MARKVQVGYVPAPLPSLLPSQPTNHHQGMFSNTKVECHVEASEDGRFVFAGLLRGSLEMLAFDITDLPRWGTLPTKEVCAPIIERYVVRASIDVTEERRAQIVSVSFGQSHLLGINQSCPVCFALRNDICAVSVRCGRIKQGYRLHLACYSSTLCQSSICFGYSAKVQSKENANQRKA